MDTLVQITGADTTPGIYSQWVGVTLVVTLYNHQVWGEVSFAAVAWFRHEYSCYEM